MRIRATKTRQLSALGIFLCSRLLSARPCSHPLPKQEPAVRSGSVCTGVAHVRMYSAAKDGARELPQGLEPRTQGSGSM